MLDEIKKDFAWGVKVGGKGDGHNNLDDEQVEWLIKQVEKVQVLQSNDTGLTLDILERTELERTEQKYEQSHEVIVGLSNDIQELKEIIADRTNDIIHQQTELNKSRQKNQKLRDRNDYLSTLNCMYRKENEQLKSRMQFQEGFLEKIDEANEQLLKAIKSVVETEPQGEEDEGMVLRSIQSFLRGVLDGDF